MTNSTMTPLDAIRLAQKALVKGDKLSARYWAHKAISLNPGSEEAWLILAAVASPQASVGYLTHALTINPDNDRARKGLTWALKRVDFSNQTSVTRPQRINKASSSADPLIGVSQEGSAPTPYSRNPAPVAPNSKALRNYFYIFTLAILLILVALFSVIYTLPAQASYFNQARTDHQPSWVRVNINKITLTPVVTATLPNTPTVIPSQTAMPTSVLTSTPIPSPTPLPTYAQDQGQPSNSDKPLDDNQASTSPYTGNKQILVDISEQHMYVYEGDLMVYSFIASTGMNNATRTGTFAVQSKIPNAFGSTWNIWMPNWLGIYWSGSLENGIHALPILPNGAILWAGYLGTPISYGCVVLGTYEAQLLYDWAEIGTPVIIQW